MELLDLYTDEREKTGRTLVRGEPVPKALRFASACGAICATAEGAGTALTGRAQVLAWMGGREGQLQVL